MARVVGLDGRAYLSDRFLFRCRWFSIRLRRIHGPDPMIYQHDHPGSFLSIRLWGWYREYRDFDQVKTYGVGWIVFRPKTFVHRVSETSAGGAWRLVFTGPEDGDWSYWRSKGKRL